MWWTCESGTLSTCNMNSDQVNSYLKHLPVQQCGVYASDCLPARVSPSTALVVNTDPHTKRGLHWIAVYLDPCGKLEYFDSYGLPPVVQDHFKFIKRNSTRYFYNPTQLQSLNSTVCGHYCLVYLYFRTNGFSMQDFLSMFDQDTAKNDKFILECFKYLYCK